MHPIVKCKVGRKKRQKNEVTADAEEKKKQGNGKKYAVSGAAAGMAAGVTKIITDNV